MQVETLIKHLVAPFQRPNANVDWRPAVAALVELFKQHLTLSDGLELLSHASQLVSSPSPIKLPPPALTKKKINYAKKSINIKTVVAATAAPVVTRRSTRLAFHQTAS